MKNLLLTTIFLFVSMLQLSAMNEPSSSSLVILENEKSVILNLSGLTAEAELFTITDSRGNVLISETIEAYENSVKYNLSRLATGRYTIKIDGNNFVELHEALITEEKVTIQKTESHYRPNIKVGNNRIVVDAVLAEKEEIRMTIYNASGELVYQFSDQEEGSFQKGFNLESLEEGDYNVILSTDYFSKINEISL